MTADIEHQDPVESRLEAHTAHTFRFCCADRRPPGPVGPAARARILAQSASTWRSTWAAAYPSPLCDEHPKKTTTAQAANPTSDGPSEVAIN